MAATIERFLNKRLRAGSALGRYMRQAPEMRHDAQMDGDGAAGRHMPDDWSAPLMPTSAPAIRSDTKYTGWTLAPGDADGSLRPTRPAGLRWQGCARLRAASREQAPLA